MSSARMNMSLKSFLLLPGLLALLLTPCSGEPGAFGCARRPIGTSTFPQRAGPESKHPHSLVPKTGARATFRKVQQAIKENGLKWEVRLSDVASLYCAEKTKSLNANTREEASAIIETIEVLDNLPESFDWRNVNGGDWTTPAKAQGACGACWAFSAIGVVEAQFNIFANNPDLDLDLSEQELVTYYGDPGCSGGSDCGALDYIRDQGIVDESCLPYRADDEILYPFCDGTDQRRQWITKSVRLEGTKPLTPEEIKSTLVTKGPVSIMIGAKVQGDFHFYGGGIYEPTDTLPSLGAHNVLLVGYSDSGQFWVIKNSWGTVWGEDGFARLRYGRCDVEDNLYAAAAEVSALNLKDSDEDGFYDIATGGDDSDDSDPNVHPGKEYQVFFKDSLMEPQWKPLQKLRAALNLAEVFDAMGQRMRFYTVLETSPLMRDDDGSNPQPDGLPDSWKPVTGLSPIRENGRIGVSWNSIPPGEDVPAEGKGYKIQAFADGQVRK